MTVLRSKRKTREDDQAGAAWGTRIDVRQAVEMEVESVSYRKAASGVKREQKGWVKTG